MLALPVVTNDFLAINYKLYFMFEIEFFPESHLYKLVWPVFYSILTY